MIKKIVCKIQEKSPLKYMIVRSASSLSPLNMADDRRAGANFDQLINRLYKDRYLSGKVADAAKEQYETFCVTVVKQSINTFRKFDYSKSRLDEFLCSFIVGDSKYQDLWQVCIFVFTLSHGQAPVERGFNVNKDTEVENLEEDSLVALACL